MAAESAAVRVKFGGVVDVEENAPDSLEVGAAATVEGHAARAAHKELGSQMAFEQADAMGDGSGGDAELTGSMCKALVAGGGLEETQAI